MPFVTASRIQGLPWVTPTLREFGESALVARLRLVFPFWPLHSCSGDDYEDVYIEGLIVLVNPARQKLLGLTKQR